MKFLKNERSWKRWASEINKGQPQAPILPPPSYPVWAYLVVGSFGYEEEHEQYLTRQQVEKMLKQFS